MIFHRLVAPAYVGGLPTGYDLLNNPSANGQFGVPAPADSSFLTTAANPNQGTYFVGFGEDGRAFSANRGFFALGTNTDFIDDFLHANVAVLASKDFSALATATITGTTAVPVFVGPPGTTNDAPGLEPYFHVTDQNNNDIVDPSTNAQVVVTGASGGVGTFFVGVLTLTLNVAPTGAYRIWYGTRSSLAEMTHDNFVRSSVWGVARAPASLIQFENNLVSTIISRGAALVGMNTTGFTGDTLTYAAGAGLKTGSVTVRDAFLAVDAALNRRRAFAGVVTDGTDTTGGDFDGAAIDPVFLAFGGSFFVRGGEYSIGDSAPPNTNDAYSFIGDAEGSSFTLAPGRSQDLTFSGTFTVSDIGLDSESTSNKRFVSTAQGQGTGAKLVRSSFKAGALLCTGGGGGFFVLEDCGTFDPALGSTNAAFEASGECRVSVHRGLFEISNNSLNTYFHDFTDDTASSVLVEDSYFATFDTGVDALRLLNVKVPTTFRNCVFEVLIQSGSGYPVRLINNNDLVSFENCRFRSSNGHVFWSAGTKLNLDHCILESTDDAPGAATSQMVMINGSGTTLKTLSTLRGNTILIGASSMRGIGGTIAKAVIEIGGTNGADNPDSPIDVDGLTIELTAGNTLAHNYTMVLLHGGRTSVGAPGAYVRHYRGISVVLTGLTSDGTGTTGGAYRTSTAYPTYVTVGGGDSRHSTIVEDLRIVDVMNPSVDHDRQVFFCDKAILRNPVIDASNISTSGKFTRDPVELWESEVYGINLERQFGFKTNQSHLLISKTTRIHGGELIGHVNVDPFSWIQYGDAHCDIDSFSVHFASILLTSTSPIISCPQQCCSLTRSRIFMDGDWGGRLVNFPAGSDLARVEDNFFFWRRAAAQILLSTGAGSKVADNNMASTVGAPTYTVSGSNSTDSDNTAFLQSGSVANPV